MSIKERSSAASQDQLVPAKETAMATIGKGRMTEGTPMPLRVRALLLMAALLLPAAGGKVVDPPADAVNGQRIAERWCAACHAVEAAPERAPADGVPTFRAIAARPDYQGGWIKVFLAMPHAPMPNLSLTRAEIADLAAYLDRLHGN
jgi:mono/diheme cytochrome c family protein